MIAEVETLYETNKRDPSAELRRIADEIDAGEFGGVGSVAVVILGDEMSVFGAGEDYEPCSIALLLHAAFMRFSKAIEEHGQD